MPKTPRSPPKPPSAGPRVVDVLAFADVQVLDVTGPLQVFATANDLVVESGGPPPYAPRVVAKGRDSSLAASAGLRLVAAPLPAPTSPIDTLIVAGGRGVDAAADDRALVAWIAARAGRARRTRRAATHWSFCDELARDYPAVVVEPDPIFVRDGPIWTSAGVTAGIDLALALVEEDLGREVALAVARYLVVFLKRPGGQAQFSAALALQAADDRFAPLHAWIGAHLDRDITLPMLAAQAGMSERSFSRRYLEATGVTPARAVERLRVEAARRLLGETRTPVKRIAQRCGFGSEETLRRAFARVLSATPQDYRARFGA